MRKEYEKGKRRKGRGERNQVWRKGTGQRIERKESLKMKDCIVKKKVRKVKTRKEKHKRKSTKGNTQKVKHKRKSHKGKNNPSWLLLFVPVFIKIWISKTR